MFLSQVTLCIFFITRAAMQQHHINPGITLGLFGFLNLRQCYLFTSVAATAAAGRQWWCQQQQQQQHYAAPSYVWQHRCQHLDSLPWYYIRVVNLAVVALILTAASDFVATVFLVSACIVVAAAAVLQHHEVVLSSSSSSSSSSDGGMKYARASP